MRSCVIPCGHLLREGRMVKCTKRQIRQLKTALHWKMPEAQRQRIQMILLRESGMAQPAIADAMGVSLSTVNRAHMAFDHGGIKALKPKPSGGRNVEHPRSQGGLRKGHRARDQQQHGLQSSDPAWLAQADAASIPSQTRHCGSKRF